MIKAKTKPNKTIAIPGPSSVWDMEDVVIHRLRRIKVKRIDQLRNSQNTEELYKHLAIIFPSWHNVVGCETGESLPHPSDDPTVFDRIDNLEQLPWLREQLQLVVGK